MFVRDWMSHHPVSVVPSLGLGAALGIMTERKIRRLPVIDDDKLVGMLTKSDIYAAMGPGKWEQRVADEHTVAQHMTANPLTVGSGEALENAALVMLENRVSGLPVVDKGRLTGIITETDVFRAFVEIMGLREKGVRIALRFETTLDPLDQIKKKIGRTSVRSLVVYRDTKNDDWLAVARVRRG